MEYGAEVKVATIVLWNFAALIVHAMAFVIIYIKARKTASLKAFFLVQGSMMIWLIGKILKTVSPTVELRWFFIVFYYFGICLLAASFLDFAYIYYKDKPLSTKVRIILYTIAAGQLIIIASNPLHYKFYKEYDFWGDDFGSFFYIHMTLNYLQILTGMFLCSIKFKKRISNQSKFRQNIISLAILVPLVFNVVYITRTLEVVFDYFKIQIFDITPLVYTWSLLVFVYAITKYEFLDLTPIMKHQVTQKLETPILIVTGKFEPLYTNDQFDQLFHKAEDLQNQRLLMKGNKGSHIIHYNHAYYTYFVNLSAGIGGDKYIISFMDVTSYEMAKRALKEENKDLALANDQLKDQIELLKVTSHVGARHYIAGELHDILGYSLVAAIKLLEVSKMFYKDNKERAQDSLNKASATIEHGFDTMKNSVNRDVGAIYSTAMLEKEVTSMLKVVNISGIYVKCFMRGSHRDMDEKTYDTTKKVITELITNTLKHSKATNMLISMHTKQEEISLQIMDNGVGTRNLVKGNGLKGIDGRLLLVGGKAKYTCEEKEGFVANITIPFS